MQQGDRLPVACYTIKFYLAGTTIYKKLFLGYLADLKILKKW
jgi:hypothetical protein